MPAVEPSRPELPVVPVACTLGVADGADQVRRWTELNSRSLVRRSREAEERLLVYRADDPTRAELEALVSTERTCCAFLGWQVEEQDGELRLRITGAPADLDTLNLL